MPTKKNTPKKSKPRTKKLNDSDVYKKPLITQSIELPVEIELPPEEPSTKIFVLGFIVGLFFGACGMLIFMRLMG